MGVDAASSFEFVSTDPLRFIPCGLLPYLAVPMPKPVARKPAGRSCERFSPFLHGVVYALYLAGLSHQEIADVDEVVKPDGSSTTKSSVGASIRESISGAHGGWGRPAAPSRSPQ